MHSMYIANRICEMYIEYVFLIIFKNNLGKYIFLWKIYYYVQIDKSLILGQNSRDRLSARLPSLWLRAVEGWYSDKMRIISDGRAPPEAEQSACKRRHSSPRQACHHLYETSKKRRLLTETETLTPEPLTTHSPPLRTNNTAVSSHSSFRTTHHHKHKKHHHHRIKSSTADGDRNWVYSTRTNLSHCKGTLLS